MTPGACRWRHRNRVLQTVAHQSFRAQFHLLSLRDGIGACTCSGSGGSSNSGTFAATENASQDCADSRSAAYLLSGIFAAGSSLPLPIVSRDLVRLTVKAEALDI